MKRTLATIFLATALALFGTVASAGNQAVVEYEQMVLRAISETLVNGPFGDDSSQSGPRLEAGKSQPRPVSVDDCVFGCSSGCFYALVECSNRGGFNCMAQFDACHQNCIEICQG